MRRYIALLVAVLVMATAAPLSRASQIHPGSLMNPDEAETSATHQPQARIQIGTICGISKIGHPHITNNNGRKVVHAKVHVTCNRPAKVHVHATMTGDTLGPGMHGPKVPLQRTTETRYVGNGQKATFYIPMKSNSNVVCQRGFYYEAQTYIYATTTYFTRTTADVQTSARVKLC